jgi:hypothetical protein
MYKINIKLAKEISLLKWYGELHDKSNNLEIVDLYPDARCHFYCGFCIRHDYNYNDHNSDVCKNCEIGLSQAGICVNNNSLYDKIIEEEEDYEYKIELIKEFIEIINNIPEDEDMD